MNVPARGRRWATLAANLDRLNHILIPTTQAERERWRSSGMARAFRGLSLALGRFTEDGLLFGAFGLVAWLVAIDVKRSDAYLVWAALIGLLLASRGASAAFRLRGVKLEVTLPRRVTVGDETAFVVSARNEGPHDLDAILVRGPFLTWDRAWLARRSWMKRLARGSVARTELRARFRSRGEHHLEPFRVQALVPFGLALGPALVSEPVRFLAVPRVANVVTLSLPRGRRPQSGGVPRASSTADSRELLGVRPYRFGDPVRDLHARTWARIGQPVVREYREEYFSRVGIVLDTDLAEDPETHFEAAVSLVAGIVDQLGRTEAIVDVMVIGEATHGLTVGRGLGTLDRALELLARVQPEGAFDASALAARVLPRLPSLSCVVFVALRWDAPRRAFADDIAARGGTCVTVVVTPSNEPVAGARITRVSPSIILAGEPVAL